MQTKRQTAGNNATLARIKKEMNRPIYSECLALMNGQGPAAVREYLGQFFNAERRAGAVARLMGDETSPERSRDGILPPGPATVVDWESIGYTAAGQRIAKAINCYEAALGGGRESFAGETLKAALTAAGVDGVNAGGFEYRRIVLAGGEVALQRTTADRQPAPAIRPIARLTALPNHVGQKLAGIVANLEAARRAVGLDSGDAALNAGSELMHEILAAGLGGVVVEHDGELIEYRVTERAGGGARSMARVVRQPEADPNLPDEADRFTWDTTDDGEPEQTLFLSGKMVGYVYEPERGCWRWVYGDGPDWSDWAHIPEQELVRSFRTYPTEAEAKAALEAFAWARD